MKQNELARKVGRSEATICRWVKGKRKVSPADAVKLEAITGVDRKAWICPDQYPNPVMDELRKADTSTGDGPDS